jgi:hypothetical protein
MKYIAIAIVAGVALTGLLAKVCSIIPPRTAQRDAAVLEDWHVCLGIVAGLLTLWKEVA